MRRVLCVLASLLLVGAVRSAAAEPAWGANCLSCHGQLQTGWVYVFGEDTSADPDESGTGAPDRGLLEVFQARRGQTRTLSAQVAGLEDDDTYAVELKRLRFAGVEHGGRLTYGPDCGWPEWGENASYYTEPAVSYRWPTDPATFEFDIEVAADAGFDYYDLVFAVAGKIGGDDEDLFYSEVHFYLQVKPVPGDLNCDGVANAGDIPPFVLALSNPQAHEQQYPDCDAEQAGDVNGDGDFNSGDIPAFVDLLTGG